MGSSGSGSGTSGVGRIGSSSGKSGSSKDMMKSSVSFITLRTRLDKASPLP